MSVSTGRSLVGFVAVIVVACNAPIDATGVIATPSSVPTIRASPVAAPISPVASQSTAPSAIATPSHPSGSPPIANWSLDWSSVALPGEGIPSVLTATDAGFVEVGMVGNAASTGVGDLFSGVVWKSADGEDWVRQRPRGLEKLYMPSGLAMAPTGDLVLSGINGFCAPHACPIEPNSGAAIWVSSDAVEWKRIEFDSADGVILELKRVGQLLVGLGSDSGEGVRRAGRLWTSQDGIEWHLADTPNDLDEIAAVAGREDGIVALGVRIDDAGDRLPVILFSDRGDTWAEVAASGAPSGDVLSLAAATDAGFFVFGIANGEDRLIGAGWHSADGRSWTKLDIGESFEPAYFTDLATSAAGMLLIGDASGEPRLAGPAVWTSRDGTAWARSKLPGAPTGILLSQSAILGDRVVVVGLSSAMPGGAEPNPTPDMDRIWAWLGR